MYIYAINICTDTKITDRYDKVAVNEYPVIVIGTEVELVKYLRSLDMAAFIKDLFRTRNLYEAAVFRIRKVDSNDYWVHQFEYKVKDYVDVQYDDEPKTK